MISNSENLVYWYGYNPLSTTNPIDPKIYTLAFSRSGGTGVTFDSIDGLIVLFGQTIDVFTEIDGKIKYKIGNLLSSVKEHNVPVLTLEIDTPNGYIVTGGTNGQMIVWDRNSGSVDSIIQKPTLVGLPI